MIPLIPHWADEGVRALGRIHRDPFGLVKRVEVLRQHMANRFLLRHPNRVVEAAHKQLPRLAFGHVAGRAKFELIPVGATENQMPDVEKSGYARPRLANLARQ